MKDSGHRSGASRTLFKAVGVALCLLGVVAAALLAFGPHGARAGNDSAKAVRATRGEGHPMPALVSASVSAPSRVPLPRPLTDRISADAGLAMYREWAKYPPNSRPLTTAQADLLEPLLIAEAPRRLSAPDGSGARRESPYSCVLQPLRHTLTEDEEGNVTLSCNAGDGPQGRPVAVEVLTSHLLLANPQGRSSLALDSNFRDDGQGGDQRAGDLTQTLRVKAPRGAWGDCQLGVEVRIPEDPAGAKYSLVTTFAISGRPPARFTGRAKDRIRDGSLVVTVEVEVERAGRYVIQANLFAGDEPLAYANFDATLDPGLRLVDLLFFGKILNERGEKGPYAMSDLRGYRLNTPLSVEDLSKPPAEVRRLLAQLTEPQGPEREELVPWHGPHTTAAYLPSQFSDAEWQSDIKTRRLAELERGHDGF